jgi:hypothetical protein
VRHSRRCDGGRRRALSPPDRGCCRRSGDLQHAFRCCCSSRSNVQGGQRDPHAPALDGSTSMSTAPRRTPMTRHAAADFPLDTIDADISTTIVFIGKVTFGTSRRGFAPTPAKDFVKALARTFTVIDAVRVQHLEARLELRRAHGSRHQHVVACLSACCRSACCCSPRARSQRCGHAAPSARRAGWGARECEEEVER